jgi:cytochrome c5
MKRLGLLKIRPGVGNGLVLAAAAIYAGSLIFAAGADTTPADPKPADPKSADSKPAKKKAKKLGGSELYAINCNRCHAERYPTEFNSAHWKTALMHMRVRANLPAAQAKEVLKYLQEESGN